MFSIESPDPIFFLSFKERKKTFQARDNHTYPSRAMSDARIVTHTSGKRRGIDRVTITKTESTRMLTKNEPAQQLPAWRLGGRSTAAWFPPRLTLIGRAVIFAAEGDKLPALHRRGNAAVVWWLASWFGGSKWAQRRGNPFASSPLLAKATASVRTARCPGVYRKDHWPLMLVFNPTLTLNPNRKRLTLRYGCAHVEEALFW